MRNFPCFPSFFATWITSWPRESMNVLLQSLVKTMPCPTHVSHLHWPHQDHHPNPGIAHWGPVWCHDPCGTSLEHLLVGNMMKWWLSSLEVYNPIQGWHKELSRSHMTLSFLAQAKSKNHQVQITFCHWSHVKHFQLDPTLGWQYAHVALQHPFLWLRTPASEFMRSHRRLALHRCNAHCCKGCRARSFYCHPWSGQSTNLNKSSYSYARVRCRCPKVAMLMHSRLLRGDVLWFQGRSQTWDIVGINLWKKHVVEVDRKSVV